MEQLDEIDLEILRLLLEDGRRPFSEIADRVGLAPPTISDRVERMRERGVIKRFTVELDHDQLAEGTTVLIEIVAAPGYADDILESLLDIGGVEHAFQTVDDRLIAVARVRPDRLRSELGARMDLSTVSSLDVSIIDAARWTPSFDAEGFAVECDECGNTVTAEGVITRINGDTHQFCCPSCAERFEARYDSFKESA